MVGAPVSETEEGFVDTVFRIVETPAASRQELLGDAATALSRLRHG